MATASVGITAAAIDDVGRAATGGDRGGPHPADARTPGELDPNAGTHHSMTRR